MKEEQSQIQPFARVPTGIEGLDELTCGGFLRGGIYLIMGAPGAGKTILSNQIGFHHVSSGGRALYVSLLSEGHSRLFGHLKPLRFFDESVISSSFNFMSAYQVLEKEGLDGLLKSLAHLVRKYKADLLFLDGVASAEELARSPVSFKKFVHDLNTVLATSGVTAFLLSSFTDALAHPEHTMVDGIVSLSAMDDGMRSIRQIEVMKLRGSNHLRGRHTFSITDVGISVYPRIEALWRDHEAKSFDLDARLGTGVPKLDKILGGGLIRGSLTSLLGSAGTGKTTLGCKFLTEGAQNKERGLYLGFYENPSRLVRRIGRIDPLLRKATEKGMVELLWHPAQEHLIDELAKRLVQRVEARSVKRLFIDGVRGLKEGMIEPHRFEKALNALGHRLRSLGVTIYLTEETALFSPRIDTSISDHSGITDNILLLRHVEVDSEFVRTISVIKTRDVEASGCIHEFKLVKNRIEIGPQLKGLEGIATGSPRKRQS